MIRSPLRSLVPSFWLLSSFAVLLTGACKSEKPSDPAAAGGAGAVAAALPAPAPPTSTGVRFTFDEGSSKITWLGKKVTGKHDGAFLRFKGVADVDAADLTKSSVAVVIDMNSIHSTPDRLLNHLKGDDFFAVDKHPFARFTSTSIAAAADPAQGTHTVSGNLEIKGVTKPISFPARISVTDAGAQLDGTVIINRQDFGVAYTGKPDDLIEDNVAITLQVRASKG